MVLARQPKSSRHFHMDMVYSVSSAGRDNKNPNHFNARVHFSTVLVTLWLVFFMCPFSWGMVPTRHAPLQKKKKKNNGRVQKEWTHPSCHSPVVSPFVKQASLLCFTAPVHQANGFQDFSTTISKAPFQHSLLDGFSSAHTHIPPADSSHFQVIVPLEWQDEIYCIADVS